MRTRNRHFIHAAAPWAGSVLAHGGLAFVLLFEGVRLIKRTDVLPPGKVTLNVPARVVARPVTPVVAVKKRVKLTSPDSKVALPRSAKIEAPSAEPAPKAAEHEVRGGGGDTTLTLKERYLFGLRTRIEENKTYPAMSKRLGETGRVLIALTLTRDGSIESVVIRTSSSFERLDRAALGTVQAVKKYAPIPAAISEDLIAVEVPIEYAL